jgi:hypothetical protein
MRTQAEVMALFNDEDDYLHSSPREKFYDILFTANNDVVRHEIDKILERSAILEALLLEAGGSDSEDKMNSYKYNNLSEVESRIESIYIEKMGDIVSQSE